jgi:hypothetical protein
MSVHPHGEDFDRLVLGRLPENEVYAIEVHVSRCAACAFRLAEAEEFSSDVSQLRSDHRHEPACVRWIRTDDLALLQVLNPLSSNKMTVRVTCVSKRSIRIQSELFLSRRTEVEVVLKDLVVFGRVLYCIPSGENYGVGIQLHQVAERGGLRQVS